MPVVMGHEASGVVEKVGEGVTYVQPGDHVVLSFIPTCGTCYYCAIGRPVLCSQGGGRGGAMKDGTTRLKKGDQEIRQFAQVGSFGEYAVVPEGGVVKIRDDAPLDKVSLVGCGVMTGVGAVANTAQVEPGSSVAVIGADYAFEVIGNVKAIAQAFDSVRRGGTAVVVGMAPLGSEASVNAAGFFMQEKVLRGCAYGSARFRVDMPRLVDLYMAGKLKLDELITREYPLEGINDAFAAMKNGEVARSIIKF
jgi:S-(hydroxymethyl)glutathione dehydrogenase/alcohol dehydrogenase